MNSRAFEVRLSETDIRSEAQGCVGLMSAQADNRTSKDPDFQSGAESLVSRQQSNQHPEACSQQPTDSK